MVDLIPSLKICFIFRDPKKGGKSIEEIFKNLAVLLAKDYAVQTHFFVYRQKESFLSNIRRLRKIKADIYHITGDINYLTTFLWDKKTVLSIHDIGHYKNLKGLKKWIFKWWWLKLPIYFAKHITAVSHFTLSDLAMICPWIPEKASVIYNPLPTLFTPAPKAALSDPPVLLQIGTGHNKNLPTIIAAIESTRCKLIIIGKLTPKQKAFLEDKKINYVNYFDIDYEQVYQIYTQADLITFVSTHEGFGMPVIEAQGVERTVITSPVCSIPEIVGDSAPMVEPHNIPAIRATIELLLSDKVQREDYISKGKENVKRFSEAKICAQYHQLYQQLLSH